MEEMWKDIPGYEGFYQASSLGQVRSIDRERVDKLGRKFRVKGKIRKLATSEDGYLEVDLNCNGVVKYVRVHRLVALTFIANPENKPEVNHKDGNKKNNNIHNLEWATTAENIRHAIHTGLKDRQPPRQECMKGLRKCQFINSKPIKCIESGTVFRTITEACKTLHKTGDTVRRALDSNSAIDGMHYRYLTDEEKLTEFEVEST